MIENLEQIEALTPLDFFNFSCEVPHVQNFRKTMQLPDTSELLAEEHFAEVSLGWNEQELLIKAVINKPFEETFFPNVTEGDCLELFFDTRDVKTAGFTNRFCHHFVILPQEVQGIRAHEITRFRTEDTHPLCDPAEIHSESSFRSTSYELTVKIPAHCLYGYDPVSFRRLGFNYRINRYKGPAQHFSVSSHTCTIEQHASLWASLQLSK
jgi:hypothetical protein